MKHPIYLDYAATTPVDPRVAEAIYQHLTQDGIFGNPASQSHVFGRSAAQAVEKARAQVAALINAAPAEIVWTSGATEANNLAIKGVAGYYRKKGRHLVTSKIEHKAVLDPCKQLVQAGYDVTYLDPKPNGLLDVAELEGALRQDTVLVSIMHVNNEIGVIQDIASISQLTRRRGIPLHVDAAQSLGKVAIDVQSLDVDLMSFSAHKLYGPKGCGALYVRRKPQARLLAQIHGGEQERGMRAGTLPTHQIVGMGEACQWAGQEMAADNERIRRLRDRLWSGLQDISEVYLNGNLSQSVAGLLNVSFDFIEGEALLAALKDLAVSSGSACTSANPEPSHVLKAIGRNDRLARSAIRFSLGRFTTVEEIDYAIVQVHRAVNRLRELSPFWEKQQMIRNAHGIA